MQPTCHCLIIVSAICCAGINPLIPWWHSHASNIFISNKYWIVQQEPSHFLNELCRRFFVLNSEYWSWSLRNNLRVKSQCVSENWLCKSYPQLLQGYVLMDSKALSCSDTWEIAGDTAIENLASSTKTSIKECQGFEDGTYCSLVSSSMVLLIAIVLRNYRLFHSLLAQP